MRSYGAPGLRRLNRFTTEEHRFPWVFDVRATYKKDHVVVVRCSGFVENMCDCRYIEFSALSKHCHGLAFVPQQTEAIRCHSK